MKWWTDCCDQLFPGFKTSRLLVAQQCRPSTPPPTSRRGRQIAALFQDSEAAISIPSQAENRRSKRDSQFAGLCLKPRTEPPKGWANWQLGALSKNGYSNRSLFMSHIEKWQCPLLWSYKDTEKMCTTSDNNAMKVRAHLSSTPAMESTSDHGAEGVDIVWFRCVNASSGIVSIKAWHIGRQPAERNSSRMSWTKFPSRRETRSMFSKCWWIWQIQSTVCGYSYKMGVDYGETFSPTANLTSIRVLMHKAAQQNLILHQMDIKTAHLHAQIDCKIFMEQQEG